MRSFTWSGNVPSRRFIRGSSSPGRWIEYAGFKAGQRVKINVEHGRLTITAE
nr:SymE family type I addiction module toxin [Caballeronia sp. GAFFF2]